MVRRQVASDIVDPGGVQGNEGVAALVKGNDVAAARRATTLIFCIFVSVDDS